MFLMTSAPSDVSASKWMCLRRAFRTCTARTERASRTNRAQRERSEHTGDDPKRSIQLRIIQYAKNLSSHFEIAI